MMMMVMMPIMMILMLMVTMMVTMTMTMMMMVAMYRRRADLACSKSLQSSIFRTSALFTTMMLHDSGLVNADDYDDDAADHDDTINSDGDANTHTSPYHRLSHATRLDPLPPFPPTDPGVHDPGVHISRRVHNPGNIIQVYVHILLWFYNKQYGVRIKWNCTCNTSEKEHLTGADDHR